MNEQTSRLARVRRLLVAAIAIAVVATIDYETGREMGFSVFYIGPVLYVTWHTSLRWGSAFAFLAAATWGFVDVAGGADYSAAWIPLWNSAIRLGFFGIGAYLLYSIRQLNVAMGEMAFTDALTGLANSRSFYSELERELSRQRRSPSPFSLAYIDLDRFKQVNDTLGHAAGDELLRVLGGSLLNALRAHDTIARLGGDEFGVLLPDTGPEAAALTMARLHEAIREALASTTSKVPGVGATVGLVVFSEAPGSSDEAVHIADTLMYKGKTHRRGQMFIAAWTRSGLVEQNWSRLSSA